jgi:Ran GTPase-activating protein (RanGAP) involved in mRNA processing and transport
MKTKEELLATCQALRKNDPRHTKLKLDEYGSLVDWKQQARKVAKALEENTVVEDLTLSKHLCADSAFQLSHFLRSSPSLRRLTMFGKGEGIEDISRVIETLKTSIVIESISRSRSLVKLSLRNVVLGEPCPLEDFLSSTRTLLNFHYSQTNSTMAYETAQAIGRGFAQNKSLVKLQWSTPNGFDFMEEVLFGLFDHINLKSLAMQTKLTKLSSQALRSLLHCNENLEYFKLILQGSEKKFPAMASVLAGLAQNKGLKEVLIQSVSSKNDTTVATAWTDMLSRNTSIKILDLKDDEECDYDYNLLSAVAEGLVNNSTLETVRLPRQEGIIPETPENQFNGPVWQKMLKNNHSLKSLSFPCCIISDEGFECLARGLPCNTSLETLDLSATEMTDSIVIALVDGLRINKTLKCLNLSCNGALSQSGRDAIERLLGYNVLRELILIHTPASVGASISASGLSDNRCLEKLDLRSAFVDGEGPTIFRALCESLRGNTTIRHLNVGCNNVRLNGVCATALKLDTMSLEMLHLDYNNVTSCGIAALAQSLQGPCTLKKLSLIRCQLDDTGLLKLGEALTTNEALEILDVRANVFTHNGASEFFYLLPQMKGLKAVYGLVTSQITVLNSDAPTEAVGLALVDGLRENTKLQKIFEDNALSSRTLVSATADSFFSPGIAREIEFYLGLNRNGRMLLTLSGESEPPSGLWPRVLAKLSSPRDTSLLFYFLQNKPKLVKCKAVPEASRKRKASNSASLE